MDRGGLYKVESYYKVKGIILFSIRKGGGAKNIECLFERGV